MTPPTDFRLYHGNALDVLAEMLADQLRAPADPDDILAPDTILIPQVAMRRWLQATLARRHGIAANLEFLTPGEFVTRALDANLGASPNDLDAAVLRWRLYAALTDAHLLAQPALASIAAYLRDADPVKAWTLAGELASVFEKYQAWRRDWLLRWEGGADPDDAQAVLWRAVAGDQPHRARRLQSYIARFVDGDALPAGLPPRLFAFGTLNVSPDVLRVMASQARVGTLHFYLPTPTREFWGDLQALGARVRGGGDPFAGDGGNPLLRDWGAAGKDFMALLGSYEVVHPAGDIPAYADPLEGGMGPASLLRRMQGDLLRNRDGTETEPRKEFDPQDPSLQFHACHTRLRELQVLHDRLRALLEDARFDPPLQPREIAVLAPDIDPYLPYLDAVFGGQREDRGMAIPYARADASLLADDALADLFLRLLALPVSRFGLSEVLDLVASAPLAEAGGLDAGDLERLHGWLREAGARWGVDPVHRQHHGAPAEAAFTWQFALDRLLLGYASGDAAMIGEVAPWPEPEGGALDALDRLLRLLRVLAEHARALGAPMPPARWRECLLGLLSALLPAPPSSPSTARALETLRALIDDFARQAERAGFDAPLPPDAVRAHFHDALGAADTRAPLLTGGVSFARMVPMRLLPFRVICLLGMNDGDFPRRDPAAGLNRLVAEQARGARRVGDRSTRDDDRFLFLQLFAAAQDVFYLSWIGSDPRDGSVREPSALVAELLTAAGACHAPQANAEEALVLRHTLQPFSAQAFGGGDPRSFSYRGQWQAGAGALAQAREPLAPWMQVTDALESIGGMEDLVTVDALRRFLRDPAREFLRQRFGMRLPDIKGADDDLDPLAAPQRGLGRHALQQAVLAGMLAGRDADALRRDLSAQAMLPAGETGARVLADQMQVLAPYAGLHREWCADGVATTRAVDLDLDGIRLQGRLTGVYPNGVLRLRVGEHSGRSRIQHGIDWLVARALGLPMAEIYEDKESGVGLHQCPQLPPEQARHALRQLLEIRQAGLRAPTPFAPYSSWEFHAAGNAQRGIEAAARKWRGGGHGGFAEGEDEALRLLFRGRDPFDDADLRQAFADAACRVFGLLTEGTPGIADDVRGLRADDAEDAE